jgi:predicted RND superfamily exporter protein
VLTTLALTTLLVGQLNLVSGFLVSALFGMGIDFAIHLYFRYLWQLDAGLTPAAAMRDAVVETLPPSATAALTTAGAFFAMALASFRGFREYGLIAGAGVLVTLATTFAVLPALALWLSRKPRRATRARAPRPPRRWLLWCIAGASAGLFVLAALHAPRVRWHNDFRRLRGSSETARFSLEVGEVLGGDLSPAAIYVENAAQARQVADDLARREREPGSPLRAHLALTQMVPRDVAAKQAIVERLRRRLEAVRARRLAPADRRRVDELLALTRAAPWTIEQVPEVFRRPLSTIDGRGQLVAVWPRHHTDVDAEIIAWAEVLERIRRELRARGIPAAILDENRVSARVLSEMRRDVPLVLAAAAGAVLLLLALHFRRVRHVAVVAGSAAVGLTWTFGLLALWRIDLNVFNQAVLATLVGVGVDNAVHIYHRYLRDGAAALPGVFATTGVAALLSSVTTAIGFGTAVSAHHLGIRSFGALAIVGLSSVFVATTVLLPSLLLLLRESSRDRGG